MCSNPVCQSKPLLSGQPQAEYHHSLAQCEIEPELHCMNSAQVALAIMLHVTKSNISNKITILRNLPQSLWILHRRRCSQQQFPILRTITIKDSQLPFRQSTVNEQVPGNPWPGSWFHLQVTVMGWVDRASRRTSGGPECDTSCPLCQDCRAGETSTTPG